VQLPRKPLLALWGAFTLLSYYLVLFTPWGNSWQGARPWQEVLTQAVVVVAAFSCLEVVRTEKLVALRAVAGAVGFPLALVTLLTLWYGIKRHFAA
jgi:hypothetical protein